MKPFDILLIEDAPSDAELVTRMLLGKNAPYSVYWVQSLAEAEELISRQTVDLILTDLGLPDSSGLETVDRLRQLTECLPIIALTGHDDEDFGLAVIRAGANDYLPKVVVNKPVILRAIGYAIERNRMTEKLREANSSLTEKNERLAKMYEMSQQFVDNVSHEFRTPLTVIREFAAIIRDGIDGPVTNEQNARLETLINRSDDLARMVDDLLDTSRLEAGLLQACRHEYKLSSIVGQVEKMLRPRARAKSICLRVLEIPDDLTVYCDEEKLRRTLINLLVNAIKFTPVQGKIEISAELADRDRVRISVADNGPGIAADTLQRIFERFQQVESHHRMASCRGFGLGLSIARALASLNLGGLSVSSVEGEGSCFSVSVPVARTDAILNCYLDQRVAEPEGTGEISVVEFRPLYEDDEQSVENLETLDDFLRTSVKSFDLVVDAQPDRWVVFTCNSETSLSGFTNRILDEWSKLRRNHYHGELPKLQFKHLSTASADSEREAFIRLAQQSGSKLLETSGNADDNKSRVLIVDDEAEVAAAVESRLRSKGYAVTIVNDGESVLETLCGWKPDAILLDVRMPRMDGLEVLSQLKSDSNTATIPVIVLSGSLHDKHEALDRDACYFLQKPFQSDDILAALEAVLGKTAMSKIPKPDVTSCQSESDECRSPTEAIVAIAPPCNEVGGFVLRHESGASRQPKSFSGSQNYLKGVQ